MFNTPRHKDLVDSVQKAREFGKVQLREEKRPSTDEVPELKEGMSLESYLKLRKEIQQGQPLEVEEPLKGKGYPYNEDDEYEQDMERIEKLKQQAADDRDRRKSDNDTRKQREKQVKQRRAKAASAARKSATQRD